MISHLLDFQPKVASFRREVLDGLVRKPKRISPKFFYDDEGSRLFERICETREYYPTRTEVAILRERAPELARLLRPGTGLIEFGSGASQKIRILLSEMERSCGDCTYLPLDISRDFLLDSVQKLQADHPLVSIVPVCADYTQGLAQLDESLRPLRLTGRIGFFPGSTLGNFEPSEASHFLQDAARFLGRGGKLILGLDLVKDERLLNAAYNDDQGYTARFNLNLLDRINRELRADISRRFVPGQFRHVAYFNRAHSRIEMHLEATQDQWVEIGGVRIHFEPGERLHTECSYKYTPAQIEELASRSGFILQDFWTDPESLFSVSVLETRPDVMRAAA